MYVCVVVSRDRGWPNNVAGGLEQFDRMPDVVLRANHAHRTAREGHVSEKEGCDIKLARRVNGFTKGELPKTFEKADITHTGNRAVYKYRQRAIVGASWAVWNPITSIIYIQNLKIVLPHGEKGTRGVKRENIVDVRMCNVTKRVYQVCVYM